MVKVERTFPAPASLSVECQKVSGRYNCDDVVEQLKQDFHNKCYICEIKPVQDPEVEHLLPHKGGTFLKRKFNWENLFWSCGHCNNVKNCTKYDAGILDCCRGNPEDCICFRLEDEKVKINAIGVATPVIERTVELLNEVYNKENTGMRIIKCEVRVRELNKEMNAFFSAIEDYEKKRQDQRTIRALHDFLSRSSAFAAFKRCYIREHRDEYPELLKWANE